MFPLTYKPSSYRPIYLKKKKKTHRFDWAADCYIIVNREKQ